MGSHDKAIVSLVGLISFSKPTSNLVYGHLHLRTAGNGPPLDLRHDAFQRLSLNSSFSSTQRPFPSFALVCSTVMVLPAHHQSLPPCHTSLLSAMEEKLAGANQKQPCTFRRRYPACSNKDISQFKPCCNKAHTLNTGRRQK